MSTLDERQRAAAESSSRRSVVVAPPGSGKTRVLVERVAELVTRGIFADRIAVLTFTRAAADEFRFRLAERLGEDAGLVTATTFHGLAFRFLSAHPEAAGRREGWTLWDEEDCLAAARRCAEDAGVYQRNGKKAKAKAARFEDLLALDGVRPRYEGLLAQCNALDFDSLERSFLRAVDEAELLGAYDAILVDEYQDTSPGQVAFVRSPLLGSSLYVVGDPRQSIYSFRDARPEVLLELLGSADWTRFDLETNYRSAPGIVEATNRLIRHWPRDLVPPVLSHRSRSERAFSEDLRDVEVWTEIDGPEKEAERVIEECRRVLALGAETPDEDAPPTLAIVGRTWRTLEFLGAALAEERIPFRFNRRTNLFDTPGGRFHLRVLRSARNPFDDWSAELVARSLDVPERELLECRAIALRAGTPLLEALPERVRRVVVGVRGIGSPGAAPEDLVDRLTGYRAAVVASAEWVGRRKREDEPHGIPEFLEAIAEGWVATSDEDGRGDEVITLTTAHSAKGLEWDEVIVVGVVEGGWPSVRTATDEKALEEDLRLLYVAATRARDRLVLSAPGSRIVWGAQREACLASRFLSPLLQP